MKHTIRITESRAISYRIPESRASNSKHVNYAVVLTATGADGGQVEGSGEGQPRAYVTGDNAGSSWGFISEVARRLEEAEFDVRDVASALRGVEEAMDGFFALAEERAEGSVNCQPFRVSLLAVQTALRDLMTRALEIPLADLIAASLTTTTEGASGHHTEEIAGPVDGAESDDTLQVAARGLVDWEQDIVPAQQRD